MQMLTIKSCCQVLAKPLFLFVFQAACTDSIQPWPSPSPAWIFPATRRSNRQCRSSHRNHLISRSRTSPASLVPNPTPDPLQRAPPPFTPSMSALPDLNVGALEACTSRHAPVRVLHLVQAGRRLVPKLLNPAIRTSAPFAKASPITSNTRSTASFATALIIPVRPARRSAISHLFIYARPFSRKSYALRCE